MKQKLELLRDQQLLQMAGDVCVLICGRIRSLDKIAPAGAPEKPRRTDESISQYTGHRPYHRQSQKRACRQAKQSAARKPHYLRKLQTRVACRTDEAKPCHDGKRAVAHAVGRRGACLPLLRQNGLMGFSIVRLSDVSRTYARRS